MVGAPVGAEIFHEPLVSAGVKAGITSLIGSTTAELMNYRIKSSKLHSPEAVFGRCHDQLLTSLENYSGLTAGASREELVIARAHLVTDAYAARLATIRLDWPAKDQYWATVEGLQNAIGRGEAPQKLTVWRPRLWHLAQSLKDCDGIDLQEGSKQEDEAAVQPKGLDEDYPTVTQQPNQDLNSKYVAGSDMSSEPKIRQPGIGQRSINWRIGQESQEGPKKSK
jgi:hypothetical protein